MFQESVDKSGNSSRKDIILLILLVAAFFSIGAAALHLEKMFSSKAPRYIFIMLVLAAVYLIYKLRLVGFRYTIFYKSPKPEFDPRFNDMMLHEDYPYPVGTVVFEKTSSANGKILAAVSNEQILAFLKPGEAFEGSQTLSDSLNFSCGKINNAHSLIYEKGGKFHRIYFSPSEEFIGYINIILSSEAHACADAGSELSGEAKAETGGEARNEAKRYMK